ncbi:MAG: carboxypeptidase regulatory-like domain-containing protein [Opitutaceae bacterium]|nr:carboxypeptidase regulatory-like domain-containing protein [Opitutaceae bacterium]MBP9911839.1 carboxypeptidase regulatory-like domain-containing protein [Opitutaceae bacterium]
MIASAVWWLWAHRPQSATRSPELIQQAKSAAPVVSTTSTGVVVTPDDVAQTPWTGTDEQKRARIAEVRDIVRGANQPIMFYGQVVDQDGRPLPNVNVRLNITQTQEPLPGVARDLLKYIDLITDANGLFSIGEIRGSLLVMESLNKDGYEAPYLGNRAYWYAPPVATMQYTPKETKPEVFRMWKLQGAGKLITADKFYGVVPDGRTYAIDVINERKTEHGNVGDFKVAIKRPAQIAQGEKYDWSCAIDGIAGGVIETDDVFMYHAPEIGYQSHYEIGMSANDPHWSDRTTRQLYLKSREGKVYARMEVEVLTKYQDKAVFSVKYYANPNGSRNLEYDPLQNVAKP